MRPAEVLAEVEAIKARRSELVLGRREPELLHERADLCRREVAAWDALDVSGIADPAVWKLLMLGAAAAAERAHVRAGEWDDDARAAERVAESTERGA